MGVPINNVSRRVVYAASGTGPYAFTFEILAAADIAVYKDDTLLTLTTDYTVTINANGTGSITLTASPTGATQIAIVGNRTIQRLTDFVTGGDLFANTINDELDQQTIFAQQNAEGLQRALQAPQTDPTTINMTLPRASVRASKVLSFDASGNPSATEFIGSNRGNWASGTLYYVRDIVKDTSTSNIWQCLVQHTSSGSQPLSTNTDSAKWFLLVDAASAGASASAAAASASAAASSASAASTSASNASSSASSAASSASAASTSASNASTSATNAASSASTASTQASNASTSATNAATSATSASNSASTATTQATNASNSASSASTSATNAANSASSASSSASSASSSASSASTSASNAASSATAAAASATSAAASYDSFDDRYLGAKTSDPTLDNDGNALLTGALYFNSSTGEMKVYSGSAWVSSFLTAGAQTIAGVKTFSSNPILDAGAANGVAYLNGSKVLTTGSALQFDGTRLGVGTSPSQTIDANGAILSRSNLIAYTALVLQRSSSSLELPVATYSNGSGSILSGGTKGDIVAFGNAGSDGVIFANGNTEQMRLTSTGLGIGTSSPAYKLDVAGIGRLTTAVNANATSLILNNSNTAAGGVGVSIDGYSGNTSNKLAQIVFGGAGATGGNIDFLTSANGSSYVQQMRLDTSGNLGLGVTPSGYLANKFVINTGTDSNNGITIASATNRNGSIWFADGTTGDQAYRGGVDYQHTTDTLYLYSGGLGNFQLTAAGNIGLGVTPSASWANYKVLQIGEQGVISGFASGAGVLNIGANFYWDGSGYRYLTTNAASLYQQNAGAHNWRIAASSTAGNTISFTQAMTLDASGNLGVGTTSPVQRLEVVSSSADVFQTIRSTSSSPTNVALRIQDATTGTGGGDGIYLGRASSINYLWTYENEPWVFATNNTERARITSGGDLLVGGTSSTGANEKFLSTTSTNTAITAQNTNASNTSDVILARASRNTTDSTFRAITYYNDGAGAYRFIVQDSGNVQNTNNSYGAISDIKLKENIADATPKLASLNQLRVVNYNLKGDTLKQIGLVAQEVEQVFPGLVETSADRDAEGNDLGTTTKSVKYSVLVPMLLKAVQELTAMNDDLRARVAQLEAK